MGKTALLIVAMFLFAATVYAAVNLPKSGQTTSYATGDDGDIQAGITWPIPRYTDQGNEAVIDNLTGLLWAKDANIMSGRDPAFDVDGTAGDGEVVFQRALDYITKLNSETYLGYNDWRLPNKKELMSLIDFDRFDPVLTLYHPFNFIQSSNYWTSTTYIGIPTQAWTVSFYNGMIWYSGKTAAQGYVWPVRTGP